MPPRTKPFLVLLFFAFVLGSAVVASAQVTTATFYGTVTDTTGALIPGGSVTLTHAPLDLGADINAVDNNGETAMHGNVPAAVQFLAGKGARIEIWNKKNTFGRTPLEIASGYRFGNFKPSPPTVAVFQRLMIAAGVSTALDPAVKNRSVY